MDSQGFFSQELKIHKAFLGCLTQVIEYATLDLRVRSSSLTVDGRDYFKKIKIK